jgi:serine/threonine protein kinase
MAPEVKDLSPGKAYDPKKADVYSLGVCLFVMLFKTFPVLKNSFGDATSSYEPQSSEEDSMTPNPFTISQ